MRVCHNARPCNLVCGGTRRHQRGGHLQGGAPRCSRQLRAACPAAASRAHRARKQRPLLGEYHPTCKTRERCAECDAPPHYAPTLSAARCHHHSSRWPEPISSSAPTRLWHERQLERPFTVNDTIAMPSAWAVAVSAGGTCTSGCWVGAQVIGAGERITARVALARRQDGCASKRLPARELLAERVCYRRQHLTRHWPCDASPEGARHRSGGAALSGNGTTRTRSMPPCDTRLRRTMKPRERNCSSSSRS
eukprot:6396054-Prymnesium_polylepis.2